MITNWRGQSPRSTLLNLSSQLASSPLFALPLPVFNCLKPGSTVACLSPAPIECLRNGIGTSAKWPGHEAARTRDGLTDVSNADMGDLRANT